MELLFGKTYLDEKKQVTAEELREMGRRLEGSTGFQIWNSRKSGLGLRRISLMAGEQTLALAHNEDKTVWAGLNGEIHNFDELKEDLSKSHRFGNGGDVELITHLYEEYGDKFPEKINGLFALALWDERARKLLLAIDPFGGIRRLYYTRTSDAFIFASEIRSILTQKEITRAIDPAALDDFMTYIYIPGPKTIFEGIQKLMPGHTLILQGRSVQIRPYWNWSFTPERDRVDEAEFFELLSQSLKRRLKADKPVGMFLSGGLDSSTLVGLRHYLSKEPFPTFSIGFKDFTKDETYYSNAMAEYCHSIHKRRILDEDSREILPHLVWSYEEPYADSSFIPTYLAAEFTKKDVGAVIAGDGPDHIFGRMSRLAWQIETFEAIPGARLFKRILSRPAISSSSSHPFLSKLARTAAASFIPTHQGYRNNWSWPWLNPSVKACLYTDRFKTQLVDKSEARYMPDGIPDRYREITYVDATLNGSFDVITKIGRTASANELIIREPYLDIELVKYINRLPKEARIKATLLDRLQRRVVSKFLLRKAVSNRVLPKILLEKPKGGFFAPINQWLSGPDFFPRVKQFILDAHSNGRHYFHRNFIGDILSQHEAGQRDNTQMILLLLIFGLWQRIYLDQTDIWQPPGTLRMFL
ncbi:MAG: asparagine synthase (glutamine-hydrolyzing) [bacterium]